MACGWGLYQQDRRGFLEAQWLSIVHLLCRKFFNLQCQIVVYLDISLTLVIKTDFLFYKWSKITCEMNQRSAL